MKDGCICTLFLQSSIAQNSFWLSIVTETYSYGICLVRKSSVKRYQNLMKHYQKCGISPRRHGNEKRRPWNASSFQDKERAVNFIKNFAEVHALPLPGRMPKFYDFNIMLLPTDSSKASVHREYVTASKELEKRLKQPVRCYGYREFCRVWLEVVPYIRVMPPASDLCALCQENATLILKSANLSEHTAAIPIFTLYYNSKVAIE